jgi:hypothetical protein
MQEHIELKTNESLKFNDNDTRNNRTPGRKLSKDDISNTSVLIRGCTTQSCCGPIDRDPIG